MEQVLIMDEIPIVLLICRTDTFCKYYTKLVTSRVD